MLSIVNKCIIWIYDVSEFPITLVTPPTIENCVKFRVPLVY